MRKVLYILGHLTDEDVEWLAQAGERQALETNDILIAQGVQTDRLSIVLDGALEVRMDGIGRVAELRAGEVVGEMSMIDNHPPSASVAALKRSTILSIDMALLQSRLDEDTAFASRFYKALAIFLSSRMRSTVQRLGYGASDDLDEDREQDGELDLAVLDRVNLAGSRFESMLKTLRSGYV